MDGSCPIAMQWKDGRTANSRVLIHIDNRISVAMYILVLVECIRSTCIQRSPSLSWALRHMIML